MSRQDKCLDRYIIGACSSP